MNIYADAVEEHKKKEFESFSGYLEKMEGQTRTGKKEEMGEQYGQE